MRPGGKPRGGSRPPFPFPLPPDSRPTGQGRPGAGGASGSGGSACQAASASSSSARACAIRTPLRAIRGLPGDAPRPIPPSLSSACRTTTLHRARRAGGEGERASESPPLGHARDERPRAGDRKRRGWWVVGCRWPPPPPQQQQHTTHTALPGALVTLSKGRLE